MQRFATIFCATFVFAACGGNGAVSPPIPPSAPAPTPTPINPSGLYVTYLEGNAFCALYFAFPVSGSSKPFTSLQWPACGLPTGLGPSGGTNGAGFGRDGALYLNSMKGLLQVTGGLSGNVNILSDWYLGGPISEDSNGYLYGVGNAGNPPNELPNVYYTSAKNPSIFGGVSAPGLYAQAALVIGNTLYYADGFAGGSSLYAYSLPLPSSGSLPDTPVLTFDYDNITSFASDRQGNLYVLLDYKVSEYSTPLVANEQPSFVYPEDAGVAISVDSYGNVYVARSLYPAHPAYEVDVFRPHSTSPLRMFDVPCCVDTLATTP